MKRSLRVIIVTAAVSLTANLAVADNYYFRLRPSVSIHNQNTFSLRIDGDRAGVVGGDFSAKAEASAPRETLRFSVSDGRLPPGISLDSKSGRISGHPTLKGRFFATVTAQDAFSTASAPLEVEIYDALEIGTLISQYATVGQPYFASFTGHGGNQRFTWSLNKQPPLGLSFTGLSSPTSVISGVPTSPGLWDDLQVNLSDSAGHSISTSPFSITVADLLKISGNPAEFATVGDAYSASFGSTGGHAPVSWSMASGSLPKGLKFENGTISGIPEEPGTAGSLIVRVTDKATSTADSEPFSIAVSQPLALTGTPSIAATVGTPYSATFAPAGGNGHYDWAITSGSLPKGLTLGNGVISGTPSKAETQSGIVVGVTDGNDRQTQSDPFSITVTNPINISGAPTKIATIGLDYSANFTVIGGNGNYSWSVVEGTLPEGLSLTNGAISGKPIKAGSYSGIVIEVADTDGRAKRSEPFSITVSNDLQLVGVPVQFATIGKSYSAALTVTGGNGNNSWKLFSGSLPTGLVLANGTISGTPTEVREFENIVIEVADTDGRVKKSNPFSIIVSDDLKIAGAATDFATVGETYSSTFIALGGNGKNTWTLIGTLPTGLSFLNGVISGTPAKAEVASNLVVKVTDTDGRTISSQPFSIAVSNQLEVSVSTPNFGTVGSLYSGSYTISGGNGNNTITVVGGALPSGIVLSNGAISGIPNSVTTSSNLVIRVTDTNGRSKDSNTFSVAVSNPLVLSGSISTSGKVGQAFNSTLTASGGRNPLNWQIIGSALPEGLRFSGGAISGSPSSAGTSSNIVIRVTDQDGRSQQYGPFSITIASSVTPGTWTYDSGSGSFTVNAYNTLTIEVFGPGAGATVSSTQNSYAYLPSYGYIYGYAGQQGANGGPGGNASGGDINLSGEAGLRTSEPGFDPLFANGGGGSGGMSYGGGRRTSTVGNGNSPGGGSTGCIRQTPYRPGFGSSPYTTTGGGGGGYARKTFTAEQSGAPTIGSAISFVVGSTNNSGSGGCTFQGGAGRIRFTIN